MGVKLSIDDFGTGYSSLSSLRRLLVTRLKIDEFLAHDLEHSADFRAIVKAIVRLDHALGLSMVAEGVETAAQCNLLTGLGCDGLQGCLVAKPMAARIVGDWVANTGPPADSASTGSVFVDASYSLNPEHAGPSRGGVWPAPLKIR